MHEDSDLRKIYQAFTAIGSIPQVGPVLGQLIASLGAQLYPAGSEHIGEFRIGEISYNVDLSDRFARSCVFGGRQERDELDLFLSLCDAGSVVWDIGANFGLYGIAAAAKSGPSGLVFAAEPSARARKLLTENVARNPSGAPINVYACAIADFDGSAPFYETEETVFSGLSDTHRSTITNESAVDVRQFDSLWRETGGRPIDLMKIDVEGHEADVLAGAREAMAASPNLAVQFEVSAKNLDESRRLKLIAVLRGLQLDGMALWFSDGQGRTFSQVPPIETELPANVTGNLFMVRRGSARESRLIALAEQTQRPVQHLPSDLEQALTATVQRMIEWYNVRLSKEIARANQLSQERDAALRLRARMPLGRRFRPGTLANVESTTAIIRVTADGQDLEASMKALIAFCDGLPARVIFADGRMAGRKRVVSPDGTDLIAPGIGLTGRYERATVAALRAVDTSHILLLDASGLLQGSLRDALELWRQEAARGNRLAGLAFARVAGTDNVLPLQEDAPGGMLALRYGLLATEALRALDAQPAMFDGNGCDLDLSLRLWHHGFQLAEAPPSISFHTPAPGPSPAYSNSDKQRLEKKWAGIFVHPDLPATFKPAVLRPAGARQPDPFGLSPSPSS